MLVAELVHLLEQRYPLSWAEDWDRVGFVLGEPDAPVTRVLLAVDCDPATVDEAVAAGVDFMFTHHPLLLRRMVAQIRRQVCVNTGPHGVAEERVTGAAGHRDRVHGCRWGP